MKFEKVKLEKLTEKIGSGSTPRGGKASYLESGEICLIRSQNIYNHYFEMNGLAYISEEQAYKLRNVEIKGNDILINITGDSIARNMVITNDYLPARVNQHVAIIRCKQDKLNPYFLSALLTSSRYQKYLLSIGKTGGTRAALTKSMLRNLEIELPPIQIQEKIGNLLKDFVKKTKINKESIELLEELAQTLFKRWFVDFEFPNENGKPYKSSGGKMVESELGMIPEGWEVSEIQNIAKRNGRSVKVNELKTHVPYIGLEHMPRGSIALLNWETSEKITSNKTLFNNGDILFGKLRPYF